MNPKFRRILAILPSVIIFIIMGVFAYFGIRNFFGWDKPPKPSLPDLAIKNASCQKISGFENQKVTLPQMAIECKVTIQNLGQAESSKVFYLANTRSEADKNQNRFSHTQKIEVEGGIKPDQEITKTTTDLVDPNTKTVFFTVNPKMETPIEQVSEANYDNNSFSVAIQ